MNDESGVLPSRFIKVEFKQDFSDRVDPNLREKLEAEKSGIAVRCVRAYQRLVAQGKFVHPPGGLELDRKVLAKSDPYTAFVNDVLMIDPNGSVRCGLVYMKFEEWCRERGRRDVLLSTLRNLLTQRLKGVVGLELLRTIKPHGRAREYVGLRLKSKLEKEADSEPLNRVEPHGCI